MPSLADLAKRLRNSVRAGTQDQADALFDRLTPVVLLDDVAEQFMADQGAVRPWSAGRSSSSSAGQVLQIMVDVPNDVRLVSIVDTIILANSVNDQFEMSYRARETASLGTIIPAQFRDRRGVVTTPTLTEPTTVVSLADAAAIAQSAVAMFQTHTTNIAIIPVGVILGPGDNVLFQAETAGVATTRWGLYGRERPWDRG